MSLYDLFCVLSIRHFSICIGLSKDKNEVYYIDRFQDDYFWEFIPPQRMKKLQVFSITHDVVGDILIKCVGGD